MQGADEYKRKAKQLLEREIAELEERLRKERTVAELMANSVQLLYNVDFAERIELINRIEAEAYRKRIVTIRDELSAEQGRDKQRPLPSGMDEYSSQIAEKRALKQRETANGAHPDTTSCHIFGKEI